MTDTSNVLHIPTGWNGSGQPGTPHSIEISTAEIMGVVFFDPDKYCEMVRLPDGGIVEFNTFAKRKNDEGDTTHFILGAYTIWND